MDKRILNKKIKAKSVNYNKYTNEQWRFPFLREEEHLRHFEHKILIFRRLFDILTEFKKNRSNRNVTGDNTLFFLL